MLQSDASNDFFISYTSADKTWAEWIAWQLEEVGYSTILQAWDFRPGGNFILAMNRATRTARRTIAVLSPDYFTSKFTSSEWVAAFQQDPTGELGQLVPVRVRSCDVKGLLRQVVYIDLVDLDESTANRVLLAGVHHNRAKPSHPPVFPEVGPPAFPGAQPAIWNLPYPRNLCFTGYEDLLQGLAMALRSGQATALTQPRALSGLGGIGKTQLAIEYTYRYYQDYDAVLWVRADIHETLVSGFIAIAALLNLPEKDAPDQMITVNAVKEWLRTHSKWLLILDNADELKMVSEFIPSALGGHLLLTTRAQAMGRLAHKIEVEEMGPEQGALLLLRRAGLIGPDAPLRQALPTDTALAKEISQELGGLPLALDQAGAYIEENQCSLSEYRTWYRTRRAELLSQRGGLVPDHPEPVATTWMLSFEKVEWANPAAAELLQLCAFLHPDAIPEEIITDGAIHLGPILAPAASDPFILNKALSALYAYSLVRHQTTEKTFTIHRLVQAVIKDKMNEETQWQWAERAVRAVNHNYPRDEEAPWSLSERYLPHVLALINLFNRWERGFSEVAELSHKAGIYLVNRGQFEEAESLLQRGLAIREQVLGGNHPDTAQSLNHLGILYRDRGKYEEAETFYLRARTIREQVLGVDHPDTATSFNNLATLYRDQGKYGEAESLYQRALIIEEQVLGPNDLKVANILNNLALLYYNQRKYKQAEPRFQRALAIYKQIKGTNHPYTANVLRSLATLYRDQGKYGKAEALYQQVLTIKERTMGVDHPDTAQILNNLAVLYRRQRKYEQAELLYKRALAIRERALGVNHPHVAQTLSNLAMLYYNQGKFEQAEPLYQRAIVIREQAGIADPYAADTLCNLARLYRDKSEFEQAELLYQRAIDIYEQTLGLEHDTTVKIRDEFERLLRNI